MSDDAQYLELNDLTREQLIALIHGMVYVSHNMQPGVKVTIPDTSFIFNRAQRRVLIRKPYNDLFTQLELV